MTRQFELTLLQERSAGTFARVYLAEASGADGLSRIVAVKVLKDQWSESNDLLDRTRDEARLLARLHHRNILRVEAMSEIDGQPAIIMEFVDGVDLKQLIEKLAARGERIPPRAAYKIAHDAAAALEAACFKVPYGMSEPLNVVHRDIKPSNIMVSIEGEVKVLDFGTARFNHEARLARTGVLRFGSMKYMSPERRVGDRGEHPSDIYALGLVLIEMLRGELLPLLPLDKSEHDSALGDVISRLDSLGLPNKDWDQSLRQTLARMCAAEPELRLNAQQIIQLLRAFSEQSAGPSLDAFATTTVARVAEDVYGKGTDGALSGSRLFIAINTAEKTADPQQVATQPSPPIATSGRAALPDPSASDVQVSRPATPARKLEARPDAPVARGPVADARTSPSAMPAKAEDPLPSNSRALRGSPSPSAPAGRRGEPSRRTQPPPFDAEAAPAPSKRGLIIGAAVVFIAFFGVIALASVGGGAWYLWSRGPAAPDVVAAGAPAPRASAESTSSAAERTPAGGDAALEGTVKVELRSPDDTVQWIRLEDAAGKRVLSGSPNGDAALPTGVYALSAKVAARAKVEGSLELKQDTHLVCVPERDQKVRCADEAGQTVVILTAS